MCFYDLLSGRADVRPEGEMLSGVEGHAFPSQAWNDQSGRAQKRQWAGASEIHRAGPLCVILLMTDG